MLFWWNILGTGAIMTVVVAVVFRAVKSEAASITKRWNVTLAEQAVRDNLRLSYIEERMGRHQEQIDALEAQLAVISVAERTIKIEVKAKPDEPG